MVCLLCVGLAACATQPASTDREAVWPEVDVFVRGAVDTTFNDGLAQVDYAASTTGERGRRVALLLRPRRHPDPVVVLTDLPLGLGPGQYVLGSADSIRQPSAYYAHVDGTQEVVYGQRVRGMLALTDTSDGWTGRFRFGVQRGRSDSTARSAPPDTARIAPEIVVEGTFRRVPQPRPRLAARAGTGESPVR